MVLICVLPTLPAIIPMVAITVPVTQGMKEMVSIVQVSYFTGILDFKCFVQHVYDNFCAKKYKCSASASVKYYRVFS